MTYYYFYLGAPDEWSFRLTIMCVENLCDASVVALSPSVPSSRSEMIVTTFHPQTHAKNFGARSKDVAGWEGILAS